MFVITHTLSPVLLVPGADAIALELTGMRLLRGRHYVAIGLAGALPDLLSPHLSLAARYSSWSHTLWFLALFVPVAILVARRFETRPQLLGTLLIFACAFHLFCDAISGGIAWGYPFSRATIGAYFVPASQWLLLDALSLLSNGVIFTWLRYREHHLLAREINAIEETG